MLSKQGSALGEEGKWDEAAASFRAAVVADPTHNAWCYLGFAEFNNAGEHCEASFEPYTRCLQYNPTDIAAHINLAGVLRFARRDVDGAERLFRTALELDPESPDAHGHLSLLLEQERGDLDGAIAEMEGFLRCGGISGFDGEAKLVSLKEKTKKIDTRLRTYHVSLKEKKTKAHHAEVRTSSTAPPPHTCFVSFHSSAYRPVPVLAGLPAAMPL